MKHKVYLSKLAGVLLVLGLLFSNANFNPGIVAHASKGEAAALTTAGQPAQQGSQSISGWFIILWRDHQNDPAVNGPIYTLTDDQGQAISLLLDEALAVPYGGVSALDRQRVTVTGDWDGGTPASLRVTGISPAAMTRMAEMFPVVSGSKPWISVMCKFNDISTEPENLAFFQGMYANITPGLDHFWREQSYNTVNIAGSTAVGWFTLPGTELFYEGTGINKLAEDCIGAADASVDFSLFRNGGLNLMFNFDWLHGVAMGGGWYGTIDGVTQVWSTTWEPPWGYADISVIQHEMGHGFGLPHSSGDYGNVYDNAWDVMSSDRYNCAASTDPVYGCVAQHTISYHKDMLGWIPASEKYTHAGGPATITLEQLALPLTTNYKMAQIPIGGSGTHFYTLEARRLTGYDKKLPGAAVIIHEVDTTRSIPARVIDADGNGSTSDGGAMWVPGETFQDVPNNISVHVVSASASGFVVTIGGYLNILSPTQSVPANAGNYDAPARIYIQVTTTPGLAAGAFSVRIGGKDAAVLAMQESSGTYTLEVQPPAQSASGNFDLQVTAAAITDTEAGAVNYSAAQNPAPTVMSIQRAGSNPTDVAMVNFTVTFSEAVTGVAAGDFSLTQTGLLSGASVTDVSGGPTLYTVSVKTGTGNGDLRLDVPAGATVNDLAGALLTGLPYTGGESYTVNKTASSLVALHPFNSSTGGEVLMDLVLYAVNVVPGITGAEVYVSYDPALVSPPAAPQVAAEILPDFFGTSSASINEVLPADQCPGGLSPCIHLALTGPAQTTKTGAAARFHFRGITAGTACFTVLQSALVNADGLPVEHAKAPQECVSVQPGATTGGVLQRQGVPANPNPGGSSLACSSVTAFGAGTFGPLYADRNGGYNFFNLPTDAYTFRAVYPGYLTSEKTGVGVTANSPAVDLGTASLRGGDVNGDNAINILDIASVISKFGQAGAAVRSAGTDCNAADEPTDINDDGLINISDLAISAGNWGRVGPTAWE